MKTKALKFILFFSMAVLMAMADGAETILVAATAQTDLHTKNFGCAGNGVADDTICLQNAINSAQQIKARLFIDGGTYLITSPLTIRLPMTMLGDGTLSVIKLATGTMDGIDITSLSEVQLYNFRIMGVSGATAGSLISVAPGSTNVGFFVFRDLSFLNGFTALNLSNAILWVVDRCVIYGASSIGVFVASTSNPDQGDSSIVNSTFIMGAGATSIQQASSGGLRVKNNKFLAGAHGYTLALAAGASTSDLFIEGNSFEQQTVDQITAIKGSGPAFANIVISGNQFALSPTSINLNDTSAAFLTIMSISGNVFRGPGAGYVGIVLNGESVFDVIGNTIEGQGGATGITVGANSYNGKICGNFIHGFTTAISNSSGTTTTTC
jgi:Pectate lyase superfamily protein